VKKVNFKIHKMARCGEDASVKLSTTKVNSDRRSKMTHYFLSLKGYGLRSEKEICDEAYRMAETQLTKDVVRDVILEFARTRKMELGSLLNALTFRTEVLLKLKPKEQDIAKEVLKDLVVEGIFADDSYALTQKGHDILY
jgi:hypothetical protein